MLGERISSDRRTAFEQAGFGIVRQVVPECLLESARQQTEHSAGPGLRNPLGCVPALRTIAESPQVVDLAQSVLGQHALLTRAILFDKAPDANWPVPPHRDTTIAVAERHDVPGFGPWSSKAGVAHVRPPDSILDSMWTLRIAIDPADRENGALRVLAGSHRDIESDIAQPSENAEWETLLCEPGDVVLMRPRTLHASDRSARPTRRRVLHLEWAGRPLPLPLRWPSLSG